MTHLRLKFLLAVNNLNFTMWVFAWGLANDHDINKKYEKIAKYITLSILI